MSELKAPARRRKKKRAGLYTPVSFVVIVAALIFGMSVFFKVSRVEVEGASFYTEQEVIAASGVLEGDNLFFINRSSIASRIFSKLPYIEDARVDRALPNRVVIRVTESTGAAYLTRQGEYWVLDKNGKVLGAVPAEQLAGLVRIEGLDFAEPVTGSVIDEQAYSGKVGYLSGILNAMSERDMLPDVEYIDLSNVANPVFDYKGKFTVRLGKNEDTEYKFELLIASVAQLSDNEAGVFDLSIDKKAHFYPG